MTGTPDPAHGGRAVSEQNAVDVEALLAALEAVTQQPAAAVSQGRVRNERVRRAGRRLTPQGAADLVSGAQTGGEPVPRP